MSADSKLVTVETAEMESSQGNSRIETPISNARCVVAEYLRDLGLRDPDAIAEEARMIVNETYLVIAGDQTIDSELLEREAIRCVMGKMSYWLKLMSGQEQGQQGEAVSSAIAVRLPRLLAQYPEVVIDPSAIKRKPGTMGDNDAGVVPAERRRSMRPQRLLLLPKAFLTSPLRRFLPK